MGLSFSAVSKFQNFILSSLIFLCSYSMKGSARIDTIKYLQEFLVRGYDLTSANSQQGTNADNITLVSSNNQPAIALISI